MIQISSKNLASCQFNLAYKLKKLKLLLNGNEMTETKQTLLFTKNHFEVTNEGKNSDKINKIRKKLNKLKIQKSKSP